MVDRVLSHLRNAGNAQPVRGRRMGREGLPEFPRDRKTDRDTRHSEPDPAEVRALARELAAGFGREHFVANSLVKHTEPALVARAVAVDAVAGKPPAESMGQRVLEAVESPPGERPGSNDAPRGNILNFHA